MGRFNKIIGKFGCARRPRLIKNLDWSCLLRQYVPGRLVIIIDIIKIDNSVWNLVSLISFGDFPQGPVVTRLQVNSIFNSVIIKLYFNNACILLIRLTKVSL